MGRRARAGTVRGATGGQGAGRHNAAMPDCKKRTAALAALMLLGTSVQAMPRLVCELGYAGSVQTLEARPVPAPYAVASVDVGGFGRFRFKPVVIGEGERIDRIALYVYDSSPAQPRLLQQAKYLPPFAPPGHSGPVALTGEQRLYAGPLERELIYHCTLLGWRP